MGYVTKQYEDKPGELLTYRPHYDRRHNVNVILSYTAGDLKQWEFSSRWNFGTGFPFTQVQGYYEYLPFNDGINTDYSTANGQMGTIYGDLNKGELPTYHRMDFDVKRKFFFNENTTLEVDLSVTNLYNRENVFYVDQITNQTVRQLPLMPSVGISLNF